MILLAGGTGRLGTRVARRMTDRGLTVRVLTRDPTRAAHLRDRLERDRVEVVIGDVRDPASLIAAVAGVSVVVTAVHGFAGPGGGSPASVDRDGNAHLIDAAGGVAADFILVSGVGAAADSPMELFRMKHAAEQYLKESGLQATIVQPTAFLELWLDLLNQTAGRSGRPLVFGHGNNPINFVSSTTLRPCWTRRSPTPRPAGKRCRSAVLTTSPSTSLPRPCRQQRTGPAGRGTSLRPRCA